MKNRLYNKDITDNNSDDKFFNNRYDVYSQRL